MGCLKFVREQKTWLEAVAYCQADADAQGEAYMAEILSYAVGMKVDFSDVQMIFQQMVFVGDHLRLIEAVGVMLQCLVPLYDTISTGGNDSQSVSQLYI